MTSSYTGSSLEDHPKIKFVPSKFQVYTFTAEITGKSIIYQILKMTDSLLIVINDKNHAQLSNLSLALTNRYDSLPVGTRLLGPMGDEVSKSMACRLNKKLNKTIYVSCNLQEDHRFIPLVEKRLYDEIGNKSDAF